jgi:predicted Rossmann fold flavoprotein
LRRYEPSDFIALVDHYGISWHEKTLGQLFCDGSAKQIVAMLMNECVTGTVAFAFGAAISTVSHADGLFTVRHGNQVSQAPSLVIATGGPSIPKMGATGFAYDLARQFRLKLVEPRPALVPFTLGGDEVLFRELSGVATDVVATAGKATFREAALFTHRGLSGPAMLQVSSYWKHGEPVAVNFMPDAEQGWLRALKREAPRSRIKTVLGSHLPTRLAETLAERVGLDGALIDHKDDALESVERKVSAWPFHPNGTEGFAKAEVTVGGIGTDELSSRTMEARKLRGLYVIGEAVDVTGWLGGYNFQWAWSSGWAAGQAL